MQLDQRRECIEWNLKERLYQRILPHRFAAGNERNDDGKIGEVSQLPAGMTIDDYGFGVVRRDGLTPRPVYRWIEEAQPNQAARAQPARKLDVRLNPILGKLPAGAEGIQWHDAALIKGVAVDGLYPLRLGSAAR